MGAGTKGEKSNNKKTNKQTNKKKKTPNNKKQKQKLFTFFTCSFLCHPVYTALIAKCNRPNQTNKQTNNSTKNKQIIKQTNRQTVKQRQEHSKTIHRKAKQTKTK